MTPGSGSFSIVPCFLLRDKVYINEFESKAVAELFLLPFSRSSSSLKRDPSLKFHYTVFSILTQWVALTPHLCRVFSLNLTMDYCLWGVFYAFPVLMWGLSGFSDFLPPPKIFQFIGMNECLIVSAWWLW